MYACNLLNPRGARLSFIDEIEQRWSRLKYTIPFKWLKDENGFMTHVWACETRRTYDHKTPADLHKSHVRPAGYVATCGQTRSLPTFNNLFIRKCVSARVNYYIVSPFSAHSLELFGRTTLEYCQMVRWITITLYLVGFIQMVTDLWRCMVKNISLLLRDNNGLWLRARINSLFHFAFTNSPLHTK